MHLCFFSPSLLSGTWFTAGITHAGTVGRERAHGRERAATMHGTAGLQGKENVLSRSVGISGCGWPEGFMGFLMMGPQISVTNFHHLPAWGH